MTVFNFRNGILPKNALGLADTPEYTNYCYSSLNMSFNSGGTASYRSGSRFLGELPDTIMTSTSYDEFALIFTASYYVAARNEQYLLRGQRFILKDIFFVNIQKHTMN